MRPVGEATEIQQLWWKPTAYWQPQSTVTLAKINNFLARINRETLCDRISLIKAGKST